MKRVVIGMSGGVDSSVSALLLKEQGFDVIGVFMQNWKELDGSCSSAQDMDDVVRVCDKIGIAHYTVNFVQEYWERVFAQFLTELQLGYTPNPDILCNREIKFKMFFQKARELGAYYLATGHYAQTTSGELLTSVDLAKDQTYFLYTLRKEILNHLLFPIGHLTKEQVRSLAKKAGLATAAKKDSTGICFIGKRDFREFVSQYIPYREGNFETLNGKIVGRHQGTHLYTIGQRKGLKIGGAGDAWFVVGKEVSSNIVYVEQGEDHPALYRSTLVGEEASWVNGTPPSTPFACHAKIRYRQPMQECCITDISHGRVTVNFSVPQRAATPRQAVVFYKGGICMGGAFIANYFFSCLST